MSDERQSPDRKDEDIEALMRRVQKAIPNAPSDQRAAVMKCFLVWAKWHIPRSLRAFEIQAADPPGAMSIKEASILRELERRFAEHGRWPPTGPSRLTVRRAKRGGQRGGIWRRPSTR